METVGFIRMAEGTRADYELLARAESVWMEGLADRVLAQLGALKGTSSGHRIDRLQHSLQTASRALRANADEETVVCALVHDIGDLLAPANHSAYAAEVLRPYVGDANYWLVKHHGLFQLYYYGHHVGENRNARERFRDHPHYERTVMFCERWDQESFDPGYDTLPLETFAPMLRRLFARPRQAAV